MPSWSVQLGMHQLHITMHAQCIYAVQYNYRHPSNYLNCGEILEGLLSNTPNLIQHGTETPDIALGRVLLVPNSLYIVYNIRIDIPRTNYEDHRMDTDLRSGPFDWHLPSVGYVVRVLLQFSGHTKITNLRRVCGWVGWGVCVGGMCA